MVKKADSPITLIDEHGNHLIFDVREMQNAIAKCFAKSGMQEVHWAEDIALAVECALEESAVNEESRTFSVSAINDMISRILKDAGFPAASEIFRRENSCLSIDISPSAETIKHLLLNHLALEEERAVILSNQVCSAAKNLNISVAQPGLYIELAKYFDRAKSSGVENISTPVNRNQPLNLRMNIQEVVGKLPEKYRRYFESQIFTLGGVGGAFYPNLKISVSMFKLAELEKLPCPTTEMNISLPLYQAGVALSEFLNALAKESDDPAFNIRKLPIYLKFNDMSQFSVNSMGAVWPEARNSCREMLSNFLAPLTPYSTRTRLQ